MVKVVALFPGLPLRFYTASDQNWSRERPGNEAKKLGSLVPRPSITADLAFVSLIPRPFPPPVFLYILQAIKNWRRERPGNEAPLSRIPTFLAERGVAIGPAIRY